MLEPIGTCNARDRDDKGDSNRCRNRNSVEHRMSSHQLAAFWPYIKQCTEDEVKFTPLGSCTKVTMRGFILLAMELMMCRAVEEARWEMVLGDGTGRCACEYTTAGCCRKKLSDMVGINLNIQLILQKHNQYLFVVKTIT